MLKPLASALALFVTVASSVSAADRPNVLFLFADDMRPDAIAALGHPVIKTPHLDDLVRRGFVFDNAYCMGSTMGAVCNPSRHMMLSGRSLYRYKDASREDTWGAVFREAGYLTYHESKRGNTARDFHKAFEHSSYLNDQQERTSGHHGRTAANHAITFLNENWDREQPLFMYVGFAGPHDPRVAAPEWLQLYDQNQIPLPVNYSPWHAIDNGWMTGRDEALAPWPRTEEIVREHLHDYYACISSIDHHVGRILETFAQLGELENTIVIFSADHGLAVGSHGLFGKQNLYEHSMGAPLIFAGPGIEPGRSDALVYLFDVFPTACDLASIETPPSLEGRSVAPVIRGERESHRETIFLAYEQGQRAVRRGDWKLYRFPLVNYSMLFNLAEDPHELRNLAGNPEHSARVGEMMTLLESEQRKWSDTAPLTVSNPQPARIQDPSFFASRQDQAQRQKREAKQGKSN